MSNKAAQAKFKKDFEKLPQPTQTLFLYVVIGVVAGSIIPVVGNVIGGVVGFILAIRKIMKR